MFIHKIERDDLIANKIIPTIRVLTKDSDDRFSSRLVVYLDFMDNFLTNPDIEFPLVAEYSLINSHQASNKGDTDVIAKVLLPEINFDKNSQIPFQHGARLEPIKDESEIPHLIMEHFEKAIARSIDFNNRIMKHGNKLYHNNHHDIRHIEDNVHEMCSRITPKSHFMLERSSIEKIFLAPTNQHHNEDGKIYLANLEFKNYAQDEDNIYIESFHLRSCRMSSDYLWTKENIVLPTSTPFIMSVDTFNALNSPDGYRFKHNEFIGFSSPEDALNYVKHQRGMVNDDNSIIIVADDKRDENHYNTTKSTQLNGDYNASLQND